MTIVAILRRIGMFVLIVWAASTLNFFVPRLAPGNPIEDKLLAQMEQGGGAGDIRAMVDAYNAKFGLDKPLWQQYLVLHQGYRHFDLGHSIADYPSRASTRSAQRAAVDHRAADHHDSARLRPRHARWAR